MGVSGAFGGDPEFFWNRSRSMLTLWVSLPTLRTTNTTCRSGAVSMMGGSTVIGGRGQCLGDVPIRRQAVAQVGLTERDRHDGERVARIDGNQLPRQLDRARIFRTRLAGAPQVRVVVAEIAVEREAIGIATD